MMMSARGDHAAQVGNATRAHPEEIPHTLQDMRGGKNVGAPLTR
jgi:hypothetical protein